VTFSTEASDMAGFIITPLSLSYDATTDVKYWLVEYSNPSVSGLYLISGTATDVYSHKSVSTAISDRQFVKGAAWGTTFYVMGNDYRPSPGFPSAFISNDYRLTGSIGNCE